MRIKRKFLFFLKTTREKGVVKSVKYFLIVFLFRILGSRDLNSLNNQRDRGIIMNSKKVYKITWGKSTKLMERELSAQELCNTNESIWSGLGLFPRPILTYKDVFICKSNRLHRMADTAEVDRLIYRILSRINNDCTFAIWSETLEQDAMQHVFKMLSPEKLLFVKNTLKDTYLPLTGAHGDFTDFNIMSGSNGHVYIIDWEFYRPYGSVITDILLLYAVRYCKSIKDRVIPMDPQIYMDLGVKDKMCSLLKVGNVEISILTALTNVCMPVTFGSVEERVQMFSSSLDIFMLEV